MALARPFCNTDEIFGKADSIWLSLEGSDWLEAFRAHPKIGEKNAVAVQSSEARAWSAAEQSGTRDASPKTVATLAEANRQYEERFGFIFIVCATGKSAVEMLGILKARLQNDRQTELGVAAEEQRKITRLRLAKLLESLEASAEMGQ